MDYAALLNGTPTGRRPLGDIAQVGFAALQADQPYQAVAQEMDTSRLDRGLKVWEAIRQQAQAGREDAKLAEDIMGRFIKDATPQQAGAFMLEVQARHTAGDDDSPEAMQRISAEVAQELNLTGGRKGETRELKVGNQIITQERDPVSGEWRTMAGAPRFAPNFYRDSVAPITDKILNGESLSEGEQEVWNTYNNFGMLEMLMRGAMPGAASIPTVTTDADYNALPSGARFRDPEGTLRTKP